MIAVALLVLFLPAGAARAASGCGSDPACVTVQVVGSTTATRTFSLADLTANDDLSSVTYTMRSDTGPEKDEQAASAISLRKVVGLVPAAGGGQVNPDAITYTEVYDAHGMSHPLPAGALGAPGSNGFQNGLEPSVHFVTANVGVQYLRPLTGPDDVNVSADARNGDFYVAGQPLLIVAHTSGALLIVKIQPTALTLRAGDTGTFSATVQGSNGTPLTYHWDFGDGTTSTETAPTHVWTTAGTYYVGLTVTGADGSSGSATPVKVTVGAAPSPSPSPTASTGTGPQTTGPASGPNHSKGQHVGAKPSASSEPSAAPTARPSGGPSAPSVAAPTVPDVPPAAPAIPTVAAAPAPSGPQVQGIVLLQPGQQPQPVTPAILAEQTAAAARAADRRLGVPGWIGLPAGVVVLLALGALTESRAWRQWRPRLRKDAGRE